MKQRALLTEGAVADKKAIETALTRFGFGEIVHVKDRGEALRRLRDESFDLVVISLQDLAAPQLLTLEREIRRSPATSFIATAQAPEADLILHALRAGVHEFLVAPVTPEILAGAVERLLLRKSSETTKGEVIAVFSGKGGLGVTSIAVNVAQALASIRSQSRVALADLVVSGGDVRLYLNLSHAYDLADLVAKGDKVDADLLNSLLTACPGGVWALPTGDNAELEESFDAETIKSLIEVLRAHFAVTVLDCEHPMNGRTLAALDAADTILLVTHLSVPPLRSTQRSLSICRRLGYVEKKVMIVANRYLSADVLSLKEASELLQYPINFTIANDYTLSASSLNNGVPLVLSHPQSKIARAYVDLARSLMHLPELDSNKDGRGGSRIGKLLRLNKRVGSVT